MIMGSAPPGPSSAGWKSRRTLAPAGSRSLRRATRAAASTSDAMWPSWPHMCATPSCRDRCARHSFFSVMRSASMSDRSATQRTVLLSVGGFPTGPAMSATKPVSAQVRASAQTSSSASTARMRRCVSFSSKPGSG